MMDLSVTTDYSRYSGDSTRLINCEYMNGHLFQSAGLKNSVTVWKGRQPGVAFMHKMME